MDSVRILKRPAVEAITGLSRSSLYAKMQNGSFPTAIRLSERSVGWLYHEITAWLESRIAASRSGGVPC